jgi:hypothetical protein
MSRYTGKPFLRLLECYVLNAIGALDERQQESLRLMEPKLAQTYGVNGKWTEIIDIHMDFPSDFSEKIRAVWERNLSRLHDQQVEVDPNEFALQFIDQNFPDAVG